MSSAKLEYRLCPSGFLHILVIRHTSHRSRRKTHRTVAARNLNELRRASGLSGPVWSKIIDERLASPPKELCSELARAHTEHHRLHPSCSGVHWLKTSKGWQPARTTRAEPPPQTHPPAVRASARAISRKAAPGTVSGPATPGPVDPYRHPEQDPAPPVDGVRIATDASGLGSWAAVVTLDTQTFQIGGASGFRDHLAELYAVVAALEWLPGHHRTVHVVTDCQGVAQLLNSGPATPPNPPKRRLRNAPKYRRRAQQYDLHLRFEHAVARHGNVDIGHRPRSTPEITAAHDLATSLAHAARQRPTSP